MKSKLEMQDRIIESAGMIYNYLSDKGEVTLNKMSKDLDLEQNMISMGLGWLSREDKLSYTRKPKSVTVKLVYFSNKYNFRIRAGKFSIYPPFMFVFFTYYNFSILILILNKTNITSPTHLLTI